MRRQVLLLASVAALVAAAVAAADSIGTTSLQPVSATLSATDVIRSSTRTCAGPNGTISTTTLDLGGAAVSQTAALNGPIRVRLKSVVDGAGQIGTVEGSLRVVIPGAPDTIARLDGIYSAGKLHGLLRGSAGRPSQRLLGNLSADMGLSGLTNGKIGGADGGGAALLARPGRCVSPIPRQVVASGLVSALTDRSITVQGTTCSIDAALRRKIGGSVHVGDRVRMTCRLREGRLWLESLAQTLS